MHVIDIWFGGIPIMGGVGILRSIGTAPVYWDILFLSTTMMNSTKTTKRE